MVLWKQELEGVGFGPEDALFPDGKYLHGPKAGVAPVAILGSTSVVTKAFRIASSGKEKAYSPHSARHCLKALGDQLCTRTEERKAWSLNLGHENMVITEAHYGKMTEVTRMQVLSSITQKDETSEDEKDLMLRYFLHALAPNTPEYRAARQLVRKLEAEFDDDLLE